MPASRASTASSAVLTRLPLWPSARPVPAGRGAEARLRVLPRRRAGRRVAGVADGDVALQGGERRLVEDLRHQAEVLVDDQRAAVADGDAGGFLAAVLQRVQAEVGELGDLLAGRPDAEDPAGVLRGLVVVEKIVGELAVAASHGSSVRAVVVASAPGRGVVRSHQSLAALGTARPIRALDDTPALRSACAAARSGARVSRSMSAAAVGSRGQLSTGRWSDRSARLPLARTAPARTASAKSCGRWPGAAR